jgi:hypothetical protein
VEIAESKLDFVERKTIDRLPLPGTLIIADKLIYLQKDQSFSLEQEAIIELVKTLFNNLA